MAFEGDLGQLRYVRRFARTLAGATRVGLLRVGIHQGLFEALRAPLAAEALAERLGLAPDLVEAWLRSARAHGLVQRRSEGYVATSFVRWLLDAPEAAALHAMIDQTALAYLPQLDALPGLMKGAERPAYGSPEEALRVASASRILERRALAALSRVPDVRRARRVLDIGCGTGLTLAGFLHRYRDAHGIGIERDEVVADEARRVLREAEVWRRAEVRTGDFMTMELPRGSHHLALLNNSLHYYAPEERSALYRRVLGRLAGGGVVAIQTPVPSDTALDRMLGTAAMLANLDLYLRGHRELHALPEPSQVAEGLRGAGFVDVGEVPILPGGAVRFIWARAPEASE